MTDHDFLMTRRWIAVLSGVGAANMTIASLRQLGVIHHLPDPPIAGFDSDAVVTSRAAYALGIPDGPIAALSLAANVPLALTGGRRRSRDVPWLPIVIAAKAVVEVSVGAWYLVQMRTRIHAWCAYCLVSTTILGCIAVLAMREADDALRRRHARALGAAGAVLLAAAAFAGMSLLDARRRQSPSARR